jgi:hypothetical protein
MLSLSKLKKYIRNKTILTLGVAVWPKDFINCRILNKVKGAYKMGSGSLWVLHPKLRAVQENSL